MFANGLRCATSASVNAARAAACLAAQTEIGDEFAIPLQIFFLQVPEQTPALTDLDEQAAAAVVILLVDLEVLGELVDRSGQDRDLDVCGSGISRRARVFGRDLGLLFFGQRHSGLISPCSGTSR